MSRALKEGDSLYVALRDSPIEEENSCANTAGSVIVFNGIVRLYEDGEEINGLFYEAYDDMALKMLQKIARDALSKKNILSVRILHRLGFVRVGEVALLVTVCSMHRREGFLACEEVVDRVKGEVPIWKQVVYSSGRREWKDPEGYRDMRKGHAITNVEHSDSTGMF